MVWGPRRPRGTTSATAGFGVGGARDPQTPKTASRLGGPGGLPKVRSAPPYIWKVSWHGMESQPLLRQPILVGSHAPAANSGVHFCGRVVGASVDARRSDLRSSRCRARSRSMQSLGAIGPMVLARRARRNGSNRVFFVTWAVPTPKRWVDWAVLETCQRSSLLTQTYGKSASMVWGRRDQFFDIWFLSVHVNLSPAANSSTHICGKLVGARKKAKG
jgi:hypothetical protein